MIDMRLGIFAAAACAALIAAAGFGAATIADDDAAALVQKRVELMKGQGRHLKPIADYLKGTGSSDNLAAEAQAVADSAKQIPTLFPSGSITDKSRAKPDIWQKWDDFQAKAKDLEIAASKLSDVAKSGDKALIGAQLKATGQACGACHDAYRGPEKS
jgi:cytochrome c556